MKRNAGKTFHLLITLLLIPSIFLQGCNLTASPSTALPPLLVSISKPTDGATYPLFSSIVIHAEAQSDAAIASYELWVDGVLFKSEKTNLPIASLDWSVIEGSHTLYVRAVDVNGNAGISNSVRVKASESPSRIATFYIAQDGDTLESIAEKYAMQPQSLLQLNSSLNASGPIPSGAEIKVIITTNALSLSSPSSLPPNVPSQPAESQPAKGYSPSPYKQFWDSVFSQSEPPTAPTIQVSADASANGCAAKIFITDTSDGEAGFYLYRLDDSSQSFKRVATLGASDGKAPLLYLDPGLGGTVNYYAAAFNLSGEVAGAPAGFVFDKKLCESAFWNDTQGKGNLDVNNIDTVVSYDKTYIYLSVNGGQNLRVPKDPKQFFIPENKVFDLAGEIKKIALEVAAPAPGQQVTLDIDVWGWQGGTLVHIGTYQKVLTGPEGEVAPPGSLQVCSSDPCYENKNSDVGDNTNKTDFLNMVQLGNTQFEWKKTADYQQGLWQVSDAPMSSSDCSINGFLNTGYVNGGGESAFFNIDFSPYNDPPFSDPVALLLLKQSKPYYVRILPIVSGQPLCQPTNEVSIIKIPPPPPMQQYPPMAPTPPVPFDVYIVSYQPIQYPNPDHARCVTVKKNPYFGLPIDSPEFQAPEFFGDSSENPSYVAGAFAWRDTPVGMSLCPAPYEESTWDVVEGYLEQAVNFVSELYNTLKDAVVFVVSIIISPVCTYAKIAKETGVTGAAGETVEKTAAEIEAGCQVAAGIAVAASMTYVGLPPSLPNYEELKEAAKGQVVDLIAAKMVEATGVPCDDAPIGGVPDTEAVGGPHVPSCKELIRKALDAVEEEMNNVVHEQSCLGEEEAHAIGIEPMCIPPGVTVTPMSDGLLLPAAIVVEVTQRADVPESEMPDPEQFTTSCGLSISSSAKNTSPEDGAPINGKLFKNIHQNLSLSMEPGKPEQFAFVLNPNSVPFDTNDPNSSPGGSGFWLPGHLEALEDQYGYNNWNGIVPGGLLSDDWPVLYRGGIITLTASATCVTGGEGFAPSDSSSASDVWISAASQEEK